MVYGSMTLIGAIAAAVGFSVLVWLCVHQYREAEKNFSAALRVANSSGSNNFPSSPVLGVDGAKMVFDLKTKRALYIDGGQWQVLEASHFVRWYTHYNEAVNGRITQVKVIVETRSFEQPRLTFRGGSLQTAEDWVARLGAFVDAA